MIDPISRTPRPDPRLLPVERVERLRVSREQREEAARERARRERAARERAQREAAQRRPRPEADDGAPRGIDVSV